MNDYQTAPDRRRASLKAWDVIGRYRAEQVRRWLAEFRAAQGWQPGMAWDPAAAAYRFPSPVGDDDRAPGGR